MYNNSFWYPYGAGRADASRSIQALDHSILQPEETTNETEYSS